LASFVPPTGLNFRAVAEKPQPEFFMDYDFAQQLQRHHSTKLESKPDGISP
jgi:hypothetical protein